LPEITQRGRGDDRSANGRRKTIDEGPNYSLLNNEIISPKKTRHSNTTDNVKAKIENVKAKIQDKEERRSWSRPTLARRPVLSQLAVSPTSFPLEEPPRQVSASHEKFGPDWCVGPDARHEHRHRRVWRTNLHVMQEQQLAAMQEACPRQEP
jgi:hypothetical protein